MTTELLRYEREASIGRIILNRPEKRNALTPSMLDALENALAEAAQDDGIKLVIVSGVGPVFCAGYDLALGAGHERGRADVWERVIARDVRACMRLWSFPKPTIASVRGHCVGGGCEVAMMCDLVIASEQSWFGQPEIRFGAGPAMLSTPFVVREKATNHMLLTGELVDARTAERIGLVNRVVPDVRLAADVLEMAVRIARRPLAVLQALKRAVVQSAEARGFDQAIKANIVIGAILNACDTPEQRQFMGIAADQGLRAALEWRAAMYAAE